ncbi:probable 4-coumarate--CoA ligase 3 [Phlebotomus argentipes]|uniref:probable 4-coumarate--CoA ligase 3 n=1 Tax=Phlebotomus argentipes TaxID=94469 RepID=UPI0028930B24|nr:probable 4-coumarate--CoA ligase 3 [Phlebotomus argentipes]
MSSTKFSSVEKIWRAPQMPTPLFNPKANLGRIILHILSRDPLKICQISDNNGIRLTNREIASDTEKIAAALRRRGCRRGDVVGFVARNGHNLTPTLFAAFLLEAPTNAMDVDKNESEIYNIFSVTKPKFIFCDDDKVSLVQKVVEKLGNEATIFVYGRKISSNIHIEDLMKEGDNDELRREVFEDSCRDSEMKYHVIVCSSGTTGSQKAVCVPYQTMIDANWAQRISTCPTDSIFSFCPIFWSVCYKIIFKSIFLGLTRIITTESFNSELYIHIVNKYKVSHTVISGLYLDHVLQSPKMTPTTLESLKSIWCGGTLVTGALFQKLSPFIAGKEFEISYGMTEMGGISTYMSNLRMAESVGNLDPGSEGIVVNEGGKKLDPNEKGELCFKSFHHFTRYLGNPGATAASKDEEGFFHTGDVGFYDEDGFLHIVGRCKEVIKYFMSHVSGSEIERVVKSIPGVAEVAAVGIHDPKCNQLPAVVVARKNGTIVTEAEILERVAEELPDSHKLRGGVFFVEKLPTTSSGKLKRAEAEEYAEKQHQLNNHLNK